MFADHARIFVAAGAGGDGASSFRREAHVPRGGPDGGDGGHGGDVILSVEAGMTTLGDHLRRRHLRAEPGGRGAGRQAHGRNGASVVARVPPGTVVRDEDGGWIGELIEPGARLVVARGGRGGRGNVHFATPTHRAPRHYEKGTPGEERWIQLELKLIAEIGLVGAPNAGKSTLLAALTAATPKVGDYPFTTTSPNLGVVELPAEADDDPRPAVMADLPGLIEGAHEGHGLGLTFLRHVERTRVLVGVIDGAADDPIGEWNTVAEEIAHYDPALLDRPMRLVVTKMDLPRVRRNWPSLRTAITRNGGTTPIAISAQTGAGLEDLRRSLADALEEADQRPVQAAPDELLVHRFDPLASGWEVITEADALRIRGRRIEAAAARTDFENEESRERFERMMTRLGIEAELVRQGVQAGTLVRIGAAELEWGEE